MASIYTKLENILKRSKHPMTCVDLYDKPEIREVAKDTDMVSDALGYMWRRGLLSRLPAPRTGVKSARFAYTWHPNSDRPTKPVTVNDVKPKRLRGLEVEKLPDGSIKLLSETLEITVRRR